MNNTFSMSRVGNLLRWNLMTTRRQTFRGLLMGCIILLLTSVSSAYGFMATEAPEAAVMWHTERMGIFCFLAFCALILFGPSLIVRDMTKKVQRSTFFMLPASLLEKFVVRYLMVSVMLLAAFMVVMFVTDLLSMLVCGLLHGVAFKPFTLYFLEQFGHYINFSSDASQDKIELTYVVLSLYLYLHSVALLCGVIFRRLQVVVTGVIFLMQLIICEKLDTMPFLSFLDNMGDAAVVLFVLLCVALAVFHFILAYRFFCRMQLVGRKWLNV